jgi:polar amino acid transport system substrate-binding protein
MSAMSGRIGRLSALALVVVAVGGAGTYLLLRSSAPPPAGAERSCDPEDPPLREEGAITFATGMPGNPPWFSKDVTTGEGFEGALAYEVAEGLGIERDSVKWADVAFWDAFARGEKPFDIFVGRALVRPERETEADLSEGYYQVDQVLVARADGPAAEATSLADLRPLRLGALVGRSGLRVIDTVIRPKERPFAYRGPQEALSAIEGGEVDALFLDLTMARWAVSVHPDLQQVGRVETGDQYALVMPAGSSLVPCVNAVLDRLRQEGTLEALEERWLPSREELPVLPPD